MIRSCGYCAQWFKVCQNQEQDLRSVTKSGFTVMILWYHTVYSFIHYAQQSCPLTGVSVEESRLPYKLPVKVAPSLDAHDRRSGIRYFYLQPWND